MHKEISEIINNLKGIMDESKVREILETQVFLLIVLKRNNIDINQIRTDNFSLFNKDFADKSKTIDKENTFFESLNSFYTIAFCYSYDTSIEIWKKLNNYSIEKLTEIFNELLRYYSSNKLMFDYSSDLEVIKLVDLMTKKDKIKKVLDIGSGIGDFLSYFLNNREGIKATGIEIANKPYLVSFMRFVIEKHNVNIANDDILQYSCDGLYDLVFSNHPWALHYTNTIKKDKNENIIYNSLKGQTDLMFIGKAINSINDNGQAFVLVPNGCLFGLGKSGQEFRKKLVENKLLKYVINMPKNTIKYPSVNYSLLVFSKGNEEVTIVDASHCSKKQSRFDIVDSNKIYDLLNSQTNEYVKSVKISEIEKNQYDLNFNTYFRKDIDLKNGQPLKNYAELYRGYQYLGKKDNVLDNSDNYKIVNIKDLNYNTLNFDELSTVELEPSKVERFCLKEGDILLTTKASILKATYVENIKDKKVIPTGNLTVIRVNNNKLNPVYLYSFLNSNIGSSIIKSLQTGSAIMNIPKKALEEMNVPILDMDTQEVIANKFKILNNELITLTKKIDNINDKILNIYSDEVGD